ncbi:MAG: tetratricopeptide repeat protein [Minwuia sp.]|nr:tetratricopeptide repeat protein [Minwuia sp.]
MHIGTAWRRLFRIVLCGLLLATGMAPSVMAETVGEGLDAYRVGDFERARQIWQELADDGDAAAQFNLGTLYDSGEGVEQDSARAAELWAAAADQGLLVATHNLALMELEQAAGDPARLEAARARLEQAAVSGLPRATYTLGKMYLLGVGVPQDVDRALELLRQAAETGLPRAEYNMGKIYRDGQGVEADPVAAADWFGRAALHGHPGAQDHYARRLAAGEGIAADPVAALGFALLAARQDYPDALAMAEDLKQKLGIMQVVAAVRFADSFVPARPSAAASQ